MQLSVHTAYSATVFLLVHIAEVMMSYSLIESRAGQYWVL